MKYLYLSLLVFFCGCNSEMPHEYILDEKDLVPEGIAYSPKKDAFYVSSVGKLKIVAIDRKSGKQEDFIKEREFGYSPAAGILVDDERNLIHALGGYYMNDDSLSSLFTFDLNTQQLLHKHSVADKRGHFLNDMIKDKEGNLYITDSKDSSVYVLKDPKDSLELFYRSPEIEFPNGIALSDDNSKLYIASIPKGIRVLDIATKSILNAADSLGVSQGIDGLEFYKGHLFAVQNSVGANSFNFRKLILNATQDEIIDVEILDSHTPDLDVPLTFCIAADKAVVIGNSNLQYLNQETLEFADSDSISRTKLLVYPIK